MTPLRRRDLALVVAAVMLGGGLVLAGDAGVAEWVFVSVLLSTAAFAGRQIWRAHRAARSARRHADELQRIPSADVAAHAVAAERQRLSDDIEQRVRTLLQVVREQADLARGEADPRPALRQIQRSAQEAHTELRRQLGLLRPPERTAPERVSQERISPPGPGELGPAELGPAEPAPGDAARQTAAKGVPASLSRSTLIGAGLAMLLAVGDLALGWWFEGARYGIGTTVLTVVFPTTLLGRRVAPEAAALAASALLVVGMVTGQPVADGFSFALVCVALAWTLATVGSRWAWAVLVVLAAANLLSRQLNDPVNLPINAVLLMVAVLAGAWVGRSRRMRRRAAARAQRRSDELARTSAEAVEQERRAVARELHDLVSHAVSVIAVQAGAGEVSWPDRPDSTRRAIQVVADTATRAQQELHWLVPQAPPSAAHLDLSALMERMGQAGLAVHVQLTAGDLYALPVATRVTLYRVVQEALTNVLRHSPASQVEVALARRASDSGEELTVTVSDDGSDPAEPLRRGFGLIGLAERVSQAGGSFSAGPRSDTPGFLVTAVLPVPSSAVRP